MYRPDIREGFGTQTDSLDFATWETNQTITIRARDIVAVEQLPEGKAYPADSGPVSRVYLSTAQEIRVRASRVAILAAIAALDGNDGRVFKFGKTTDADSGALTDVWDGADAAGTGPKVWVPPTTARTHDLTSSSALDNGVVPNTGLRTVRVTGLTSWTADEVSEVVTLNGVANVATVNQYVIIHRMEGLTWGAGGANAGIITATAQTDGTLTAAIQTGNNQTLMAIYGVPSTQVLMHASCHVSMLAAGIGNNADMSFLVNETPDVDPAGGFLVKNTYRVASDDAWHQIYDPKVPYPGPALIKMQVVSDTNNSQITGSFNAALEAA